MRNRKNNRLLKRFVFSYIGIAGMAFVIMLTFFQVSASLLTNEANQKSELVLQRFQRAFDHELTAIISAQSVIANNRVIREFSKKHRQYSPEYAFEARELCDYVKGIGDFAKDEGSYFLYFSNSDSVITDSLVRDTMTYYTMLKVNLPYEEWKNILQIDTKGKLRTVPMMDGTQRFVYVGRNFFTRAYSEENMSFVVIFDPFLIAQRQCEMDLLDAYLCIMDKNESISCNQDMPLSSGDMERLGTIKGTVQTNIAGRQYIVSVTQSTVTNLHYLVAIPVKQLFQRLLLLRIMGFIALFVLMIGSSALVWILSRRQYAPILDVMRSISVEDGKAFAAQDEYQYIQSAITHINQDRRNLQNSMQLVQKRLQSEVVQNLISHGYLGFEALLERDIEMSGLPFSADSEVLLMLIQPKTAGAFDECVEYAVSNVVEELCGEHRATVVSKEELLICLICLAPNTLYQTEEQLMIRVRHALGDILMDEFKCPCVFANSKHTTLWNLRMAYIETLSSLDRKVMVSDSSDEKSGVLSTLLLSTEKKEAIRYAVEIGNSELLNEMVTASLRNIYMNPAVSANGVAFWVADYVAELIQSAGERVSNQAELEQEIFGLIGMLNDENLAGQLIIFTEKICQEVTKSGVGLEKKITAFIEENYADENLSLTQIAEHFHLNASYLSFSFKEQRGEGILETIHKTRMSHALALLKEKRYTISEVRTMVGCSNANTFTRLFRKYYGVKPSSFLE